MEAGCFNVHAKEDADILSNRQCFFLRQAHLSLQQNAESQKSQ
jgi:hypothetical protein